MTGVLTGVLSAVDSRPLSLALGEEMSGGGVSMESSFTAVVFYSVSEKMALGEGCESGRSRAGSLCGMNAGRGWWAAVLVDGRKRCQISQGMRERGRMVGSERVSR
jgi:hypothetical protein